MTGMFQSSSTASGSPRLQTSSAFSPSSASMIWKSRLSSIRRATFRITLESSTTRHVLIFGLLLFQCPDGTFPLQYCLPFLPATLRRHQVGRDFEHAIDVEDDHELAFESVDAAGELGHAGIEIDGVFLAAVFAQLENLPDLVDQEPVGFAAQVEADLHRQLAVIVFGQAEPGAHVDHGDDAAAQVEDAGDFDG